MLFVMVCLPAYYLLLWKPNYNLSYIPQQHDMRSLNGREAWAAVS